jgi:hypothetical protein
MIVSHNNYGQTDLLMEAQNLCTEKKFDLAIPVIDKVVRHPDTKNNYASWHIRSFAYIKSISKPGISIAYKTSLIDTALYSAIKSIKLDSTKEYLENNLAFIKKGASTYFLMAKTLLQDSLNNSKSEKYYNNYKKYLTITDPSFDFKISDIEYYKTTGSIFTDLYSNNNFNQKYGDVAKYALTKVLEFDPKNIGANINLGVLYYNQGVTLMQMMEYDVDLAQLAVVQENAKKLFKQSLPFMIKVYEQDPKATQAVEGLIGIYTALLDEEKAAEYKHKQEALNKK